MPRRCRLTRGKHDGGDDILPEPCIRDAKNRRLGHGGMAHQDLIDLVRHDLLPAAVDDLIAPPGEVEVAELVQDPQVTGAKPPAGEKRGRIRLGIIQITRENPRPAHGDLPAFVLADRIATLIDELDVAPRLSDSSRHAVQRRVPFAGDPRCFGHAIAIENGTTERLLQLAQFVGWERAGG
jgi:hypothetical protein